MTGIKDYEEQMYFFEKKKGAGNQNQFCLNTDSSREQNYMFVLKRGRKK